MSAATKFLVVAVMAFMALIPTQVAVAADATLYELSEEMTVDSEGYRWAKASFQGTAQLGTPLCPQLLASLLASGEKPIYVTSCTVSGVGSDKVDIATDGAGRPLRPTTFGTGRLWGTFAVVVNADNMVDAPEYVVMTGTFGGDMFLTAPEAFKSKKQTAGPATQRIVMANGVFTPANVLGFAPEQLAAAMQAPVEALGLGSATFSGVFRLPFALTLTGQKAQARRYSNDSYYLSDTDSLVKVRKDEMSLGYPTVRIEVNFNR